MFEGVEIEFEGTFYSPVDTRDFQRRLSDGVTPYGAGHQFPGVPPVIPASYVNNPNFNAALQQDTQDYSSSLVFQVGDQGVQRRVWSNPNPSIEIKNIWTKDPRINLDCDPLENGIIACNKGRFFQTGGLPDLIVDPQFEFKSGVKSYFKVLVQNRNDDKRIFNITGGQAIGTAVIKAQIDAAVQANTGDKLAEWGRIRFGGADNTNYAQILNSLSNLTSEWENDSFEGAKKADFKDSIAAKGIMAWQEVKGLKSIRNYFKLKKFNEWTLSGELEKGKLETITP